MSNGVHRASILAALSFLAAAASGCANTREAVQGDAGPGAPSAASPSAAAAPAPVWEREPEGAPARFVLVDPRAKLYREPKTDATAVPLALDGEDPQDVYASGRRWVMRLRAVSDAWVEVETLPEAARGAKHCQDSFEGLRPLKLKLFALRASLSRLTARQVRIDYPDKTSMIFAAGVPVEERKGAPRGPNELTFDVRAGSLTIPASLPADAVGWRYEPQRDFEDNAWDVKISADDVKAGALRFDGEQRVASTRGLGTRYVAPVGEVGDDALVRIQGNCGAYTVRVAKDKLVKRTEAEKRGGYLVVKDDPDLPIGYAMLGLFAGGEEPKTITVTSTKEVKNGARVFWPDGAEAGVLPESTKVRMIRMKEADAPKPDLRCFGRRFADDSAGLFGSGFGGGLGGFGSLGGGKGGAAPPPSASAKPPEPPPPHIVVCFKAEDVIEPSPPPAASSKP